MCRKSSETSVAVLQWSFITVAHDISHDAPCDKYGMQTSVQIWCAQIKCAISVCDIWCEYKQCTQIHNQVCNIHCAISNSLLYYSDTNPMCPSAQ